MMEREDIAAWLDAAANNSARAKQLFATNHPVTATSFMKAAIEGLQSAYAALLNLNDEGEKVSE